MKFYVLQRDYGYIELNKQFKIFVLDYPNETEAWEYVEENIKNNDSEDWLLTEEQYTFLSSFLLINRFKQNEAIGSPTPQDNKASDGLALSDKKGLPTEKLK